jgi:hypothetical protein
MARVYLALLPSAPLVSALGKVYLGVSLTFLLVGIVWASSTLSANAAWVEIVLAVPRLDLLEPVARIRYEVNLAALLAGWMIAAGIVAVLAMRAPFRIRGAAVSQRRIRELEREVLELRTLPLRQQEEDEILAAEAHVDAGTRKVMTERFRVDVHGEEDDDAPDGGRARGRGREAVEPARAAERPARANAAGAGAPADDFGEEGGP